MTFFQKRSFLLGLLQTTIYRTPASFKVDQLLVLEIDIKGEEELNIIAFILPTVTGSDI